MKRKTSLSQYRDSDLVAEYIDVNGNRCEVTPFLKPRDRIEYERLRDLSKSRWIETHHILGDKHYKVDNWSNLVRICSVLHKVWGHSKYPVELRVTCLYAKYSKAEFDIQELNVAGQKDTIRGEIWRLYYKLANRPDLQAYCSEMLAVIPE